MAYTTREVATLTGATYRQLDYWARVGWLPPSVREAQGSGAGKKRLYSDEDVEIARVLLLLWRLWEHLRGEVAREMHRGTRHFVIGSEAVNLTINLDAIEELDHENTG